MKRSIRAAAAVASVAVLLAACGGGGGSSSGGDGSSGDTIKIGAWFPLSGAQASSGTPQMQGVVALWKKVNAEGGINGKKVDFIYEDNAFDPQQTLQIARKMVTQDKVVAIANTNGTSTTEATFPLVLQQNKIPIYGTYGGLANWYNPPRDLLFGTQTLYEDQATVAAEWALENGKKNITIVHDDPKAFVSVRDVASKVIASEGGTANSVEVKIGTTDYSPVIPQVQRQNPDAVLLVLPPQEAAAYLNAAALQNLKVPVYGYAPATVESTIELAGKNAEGFRGVSLTMPATSDDATVKEYRDTLTKYGDGAKPNLYSLATYAYAKSFAAILKTIKGEVTSESITKAILASQNIETGIAPPLSFSATRHLGTDEVVRVEVDNGQFVAKGSFIGPKNK